jgi:hypothetical protein
VTADVQASLRKLASLSQDLNQASDRLSAELDSVETAVNKLKLGVNAWASIRAEEAGEGYSRSYSVGYCKIKGKWGLVLFECIDGMEEDGEITPLRDASRDLRVEAAEKLGELIEALAKEAAKTTENVTKRAAEAKKIASALSNGRT